MNSKAPGKGPVMMFLLTEIYSPGSGVTNLATRKNVDEESLTTSLKSAKINVPPSAPKAFWGAGARDSTGGNRPSCMGLLESFTQGTETICALY